MKAFFIILVQRVLYSLSFLVPRNQRLAVLGAWEGRFCADNPKYLAKYLVGKPRVSLVWIGDAAPPEGTFPRGAVRFVPRGSALSFFVLIRAKYWVYTHNRWDVSPWAIYGGAKLINLWHGIPLKYMGVLTPAWKNTHKCESRMRRIRNTVRDVLQPPTLEWTAISSEGMAGIMAGSWPNMFSPPRMLRCGLPRNDFLLHNISNTELHVALRAKYSSILGLDPSKTIILYMPTWRMTGVPSFAFSELPSDSLSKWNDMLSAHNAQIVEKAHFSASHSILRHVPATEPKDSIVALSELQAKSVDTQELLLISDILVTDYSSVYFDYSLLKRPIVHFAYDLSTYLSEDAGLAYDFKDVAGGTIVATEPDLFSKLRRLLWEPVASPAQGLSELVKFETGHACENVAAFMGLEG